MNGYETPIYVDIVLGTIYVLIAAAVLLSVWSAVRSYRRHCSRDGRENGVPARRIALAVALLTVVALMVTWLTASTKPLNINGHNFDNGFWLHASDMFIGTAMLLAVVLIAVAVGGAVKGLLHKE